MQPATLVDMTHHSSRFAALGLVLPTPPKAVAAYVPWCRTGNLVYVSGQLPFIDGKVSSIGAVPSAVSLDNAKAAARQCALNALAIIADALKEHGPSEHGPSQHGPSEPGAGQAASGPGALDRVVRVVRLGVFVCSDAGFTQQPQVANGASELMEQVFGEAGRHARAAVGSIALPLGASVEVEVLVEVR